MGLAALRKILEPAPLDPASLRGRTLAVDADNLLWSFVTAFGATGKIPTGPDGQPIGHLLGLVNRLKLYASWGARSAWVFDGPQPKLKEATLAGRVARIEAAKAAGAEAGGIELTRPQVREAKELMSALGVPWMVAPAESDAQCAHFARSGAAWLAVTQDWDIALHGAPRAGRNLTGSQTRAPELLDLDACLATAGLTREQLVDAAILIGTDYNEGIPGVGPVKAVKAIKKAGDLHGALRDLGHALPQADEIRALFLAHPVDASATLTWREPDAPRVADILARAGLSGKRADDVVSALRALHAPRQTTL